MRARGDLPFVFLGLLFAVAVFSSTGPARSDAKEDEKQVEKAPERQLPAPSPVHYFALNDRDARIGAAINRFRASYDKRPLRLDPALCRAAKARAPYYSHHAMGQDPGASAANYGFHGSRIGENIAMGQSTPESAVDTWIHSPGHRANMLGRYNCMGVAVVNRKYTAIFGYK